MTDLARFVDDMIRLRRTVVESLLGKLPQASADFDQTRIDVQIFEELTRIKRAVVRLLLDRMKAAAEAQVPSGPTPGAPAGEQDLVALVEHAQRLVVQHPVAAQQAFSALVAEGRRFAASPEGAQWERALAESQLLRRTRQVWESTLASFLEESPDTVVPSTYVELLMRVAELARPEEFLARLPRGGGG
jgi:hypothetical protein